MFISSSIIIISLIDYVFLVYVLLLCLFVPPPRGSALAFLRKSWASATASKFVDNMCCMCCVLFSLL